jgi:hypothetical protein
MNRIIHIILLVFLAMLSSMLIAQDPVINKNHSISLNTQFMQIKDEFNYGLVFNGLNLGVRYSFTTTSPGSTLSYTPDMAVGANFKKGLGIVILFRPVNLFYGININQSNSRLIAIGPYIATNYQWQNYSELQSGHMFWFTSLETGPEIILTLPFKSKLFKLKISNSLAGWTSRPEPSTETMFYSHKISDFASNAHSNMKFGSYGLFDHTNFKIEMLNAREKKPSLAYQFEYFGYYQAPKYLLLLHSINLKWKIGKNKM